MFLHGLCKNEPFTLVFNRILARFAGFNVVSPLKIECLSPKFLDNKSGTTA